MTLLFDDTKRLEKALGSEAAAPLIDVLNSMDARTLADLRTEVATKADIPEVKIDIAKLDGKIDKLAIQVKLLNRHVQPQLGRAAQVRQIAPARHAHYRPAFRGPSFFVDTGRNWRGPG